MSKISIEDIDIRSISFDVSVRTKAEVNANIRDVEKITDKHLSEPYSIYVYRFFINNWPDLCLIASHEGKTIGNIICKVEPHRNVRIRGYIGMLTVEKEYRNLGIARKLIEEAITKMIDNYNCDEITLETEVINKKALKLYEDFGFIRIKRLFRYYMNRHDAYRLVLPITEKASICSSELPELKDPDVALY